MRYGRNVVQPSLYAEEAIPAELKERLIAFNGGDMLACMNEQYDPIFERLPQITYKPSDGFPEGIQVVKVLAYGCD